MTANKTVYVKNPGRSIPEQVKRYTPQYEEMGVEPVPFLPAQHQTVKIQASKNVPNPTMVYGQTRRGIPNVGSIDSFETVQVPRSQEPLREVIVDDLSVIDPNRPMIDNNDQHTTDALNISDEDWERLAPRFGHPPLRPQRRPQFETHVRSFESTDEEFERSQRMVREGTLKVDVPDLASETVDPLAILKDLEPDQYLLLVFGSPICSAPLKEIEEEVNALLFGTHEISKTRSITEEDILVVKKVSVKIGVFLEG